MAAVRTRKPSSFPNSLYSLYGASASSVKLILSPAQALALLTPSGDNCERMKGEANAYWSRQVVQPRKGIWLHLI